MTAYLKRAGAPRADRDPNIERRVHEMLAELRSGRDDAARRFARELDGWAGEFRVSPDRIRSVARDLPETFKEDFAFCKRQVSDFAQRQRESLHEFEIELTPGTVLGQKLVPVQSVGCYVPGGKYPLISAAIMSVTTARVAGVEQIAGCAPPRDADGIFPHTLYALDQAGADAIFCIGGVQAMAAMAFGLVGLPAVDMITGPGNAYVAEAKRQLFGTVGVDLPAGPTEILIIADETADPGIVAADLLGQAEHGPDSPAWLITTSAAFAQAVLEEVGCQLGHLSTAAVAGRAWEACGEIAIVDDDDAAIALSDDYAPEHLELQTGRDAYYQQRLRNYGSLFVGAETTVAYGDKGIGPNHTLPTGRAARYTGGLWVGKFIKTLTYQRLSPSASRRIAPVIARMCESEGMVAHQITAEQRIARYARHNEPVD